MNWIQSFFLIYVLSSLQSFAQINSDSTYALPEVLVTIYPTKISMFRSPSSIGMISEKQLHQQPGHSLVPSFNTVSGVRMEERSPGSYRLSIRGSVLRSPFGIRNIKLYLDDFPLTDAGGNTYLNSLDAGSIRNIEILKGPEGSLFGANTGGVILLNPLSHTPDSTQASISLSGGSFGLFHEKASLDQQWKKYRFNMYQAYQRSDGYRENSALQRLYLQTIQQFNYTSSSNIKLLILYSDLLYRTPGGLTQNQYDTNPRASRPAGGPFNSAIDQKAAIYNKTAYAGLSHEVLINDHLRHVIALFGSLTDFKNPFITNYEVRKEKTGGLRTYLEWRNKLSDNFHWKWNVGLEAQQTHTDIHNYGNNLGEQDTLQAADKLRAQQYFFFTQLSTDIGKRLIVEAALSFNHYNYRYQNRYPLAETETHSINFQPQLLPRIAVSYKVNPFLVWRASASKGYSPPTLAEVRPSTNSIYSDLQPESGWNYESGIRIQSLTQRIQADIVFFYFQLDQAIVRRVNASGADYFVNAGSTNQKGIEVQLTVQLIPRNDIHVVRGLQLRNGFTYYDFRFANYQIATENYSDNKLTGVPPATVVTGIELQLPKQFYFFAQHYYTGRIPLNDGNSMYANDYHLLQFKAGTKFSLRQSMTLELFAGVDNVLNSKYSLGNDLNALGGRYYNAAPLRNYYGGVKATF
ncbi:MAG: TonB-dependent receptor [Cytophagaceae bacterium]|jgi:iron complex outermembrane receptor protein|nr:TonB-dependent receptor [Cytophagaceae bacterium]